MAFLAIVSVAVIWSRDQVKVRDGQIMTVTRIKRLPYQVQDVEATKARKEEARKSSPRIYRLNTPYMDRLEASLKGLPKAVAGKTSLDEINVELLKEFELTEDDLGSLQAIAADEVAGQKWERSVGRLIHEQLDRKPLLRSQEFQILTTTLNNAVMLPNDQTRRLTNADAIEWRSDPTMAPELRGNEVSPRLRELVTDAGFSPKLAPLVMRRLVLDSQPTLLFSEEDTNRLAEQSAAAALPVYIKHEKGEVLYRRGDLLTPEQYTEVRTEAAEFRGSSETAMERWKTRLGTIGLIAVVALFLGTFATIAYPRIVRNPLRMAAICALMSALLGASVVITVYAPIFLLPAAIGPTLFVSIILLVAYDQRLALLLTGLQCMIVTLALDQSIGFFILLVAICATMISQLKELRHRNSLIRAATMTATVAGVGTLLLVLLEIPMVGSIGEQMLAMAFSAVGTCYGIAFLVLGILPSIEKLFDITTGMTLAELRDPKRPLLRQLQQRAPGTYNHSLQVANIAEAAAEAIGAHSLLVYVGALYHDVGKINKPDYFIENQGGGHNRHDKLSPAMSLLVIIGHVKNGIELAHEYGLPRQITHFIESHHGTTLVEYFYHAARAKAETDEDGSPVAEVEYRYPGPKPQTKEAAILMLSDAVESSTRAMAEPTPSRIENLVRTLSKKRLEDSQFDQCDLTFKELALIEDAIISRLLSIYHSRISYPSSGTRSTEQPQSPRSEVKAVSA